jgi:co-chaperonin GroES (HSP10)
MKPIARLLDQSLEDAFPNIDPGETPCGSLLLIQVRRAANKTKAGIVLTGADQATEFDNTHVAKVIKVGALAYHTRDDMKPWPEGAWVKEGDYIRFSQHNAKTWTVPLPGTRGIDISERVTFGYLNDLHVSGIVKDPLATKAFF